MARGRRRWGRSHAGVLVAGVLLLGGCDLRGGPGERIRGEGFELRCDPGCGPRAADLLADLGRTRDSVAVWFGLEPSAAPAILDGERRLRIRLYASEAPFLRADRRLASGRFARQQAFSHQRSRSAHILAEGFPDPRRWERFGPGFQGERLVVHEAAHLVTYALSRDARWPPWVSEGIAAHAEERWAAGLTGESPEARSRVGEPWLHTQRYARARLLESEGIPAVAALIRSDLDHLPLTTRYAVWAAFMGVLLEEPFRGRTRGFLRELAGPAPPAGWTRASVARRFEARFDPASIAALDARVQDVVSREEVSWAEVRRSAGWTPEGLLQLPVSRDPLLWRLAPPTWAGGPPEGGVTLRAVAERVGRGSSTGSGLLLVLGVRDGVLDGDAVGVVVGTDANPRLVRVPLQSDALPTSWTDPAAAAEEGRGTAGGARGRGTDGSRGADAARERDRPPRTPGPDGVPVPVPMELSLDAEQLTLRVGGLPDLRWDLPGIWPSGDWGVGTTGGMAVLWRELDLAAVGHELESGGGPEGPAGPR